jgi:hypothetical protein
MREGRRVTIEEIAAGEGRKGGEPAWWHRRW